MALVSGVVLGGEDDGLASESMAQSVQLGALFAGFGTGPSGFLGVFAIDGSTIGDAISAVSS